MMQLYKFLLLIVSVLWKCKDAVSVSCIAAHTDSQDRKDK